MIEATGAAIVKAAASSATRPIWSKLSTSLLGTPEERALAVVYRKAVARAVQEVSRGDLPEGLIDLAESQFGRLLAALPQTEVARLSEPDEHQIPAVVGAWRLAADDLNIDTTTMAVDFERTSAALLRYLPMELADAAGEMGSALTARRVVDTVGSIRAMLDGLIDSYAGTLDIDPAVVKSMRAVERTARVTGRAMHRPDMLHALLRMPSSAVAEALNTAGAGTAAGIRDSLAKAKPGSSLQPAAAWQDWAEIPVARRVAVLGGLSVVTDLCLLLAFLDDSCDSKTMADLRDGLDTHLNDVRRAALRMVSRPRTVPTPISYLDGWRVG